MWILSISIAINTFLSHWWYCRIWWRELDVEHLSLARLNGDQTGHKQDQRVWQKHCWSEALLISVPTLLIQSKSDSKTNLNFKRGCLVSGFVGKNLATLHVLYLIDAIYGIGIVQHSLCNGQTWSWLWSFKSQSRHSCTSWARLWCSHESLDIVSDILASISFEGMLHLQLLNGLELALDLALGITTIISTS